MRKHIYRQKKNSIFPLITLVILLNFFSLYQPLSAYADEENIAGAAGFSYSIEFPENQVDKELGYYHLKMESGKSQKLNIALSNPSSEKITVDVQINGAKTNQNGVIEYGESTIENDSSLKFDFADLVTGPDKVELNPGETKNLELTVQMPETEYDGLIAGGIQLMRSNQDGEVDNDSGSKIINQYAYVIAAVLQEKNTVLAPDLSLNSVTAGQNNYRNAVFVDFSNVISTYLDDMTVEVQITEKGKDAVLYERKQTAMRMAPNSFINFPVSMNGEQMVAGKYVANILVTSDNNKWQWKEEFDITKDDANKFNERDVGLVQEKGLNWKLVLLIVVIILIVILLIFLIIHSLQKKKQQKELALKKARKKQLVNKQQK